MTDFDFLFQKMLRRRFQEAMVQTQTGAYICVRGGYVCVIARVWSCLLPDPTAVT